MMSRNLALLILGFVVTVVVGVLAAGAYILTQDRIVSESPVVVVTATAALADILPTATQAGVVTATVPAEAAVPTAAPTATATATATAVTVQNTPVQYILAQTDVNMRSGPGTGYAVIGWVAGGQLAQVTGVSSDSGWWRVVCADGSTGSCWVTARSQYTQPTTAPGSQPPPTATSAVCTNAATFVADVTVPDGSEVETGSSFVKSWRIQNSGTCTWDGRYQLVHAGGPLLGAVFSDVPMPAVVAPGQMVDLSVQMLAPVTPGTYQSDWKMMTPSGVYFGVGRNNAPLWVKIAVVAPEPVNSTISGVVYQDGNGNGRYDAGEVLMGSRNIWLVAGSTCQNQAAAVVMSGSDGRFTLKGSYNGSFCIGLRNESGGFDDVTSIALAAGQTLTGIDLRFPVSNGSISGFLWDDYCLTTESGEVLEGSCVAGAAGGYVADGMIQPTEQYISGVTLRLQAGGCVNNTAVAVTAVTDVNGRYVFDNLGPGTYCVSMNAAADGNAPLLLPGDWSFPARGIWYQEIVLRAGDSAYPVNFGWDYQLR